MHSDGKTIDMLTYYKENKESNVNDLLDPFLEDLIKAYTFIDT